MYDLKVGEIVIVKPKRIDEREVKAYIKEIIIHPTSNHSGVYHSGVFNVHGFGEMFGDDFERTGRTISDEQLQNLSDNEEEVLCLA